MTATSIRRLARWSMLAAFAAAASLARPSFTAEQGRGLGAFGRLVGGAGQAPPAAAPATQPATAPAAPPVDEAKVQRLVAALRAEEWKAREAAYADLVALGVGARPALERAIRQTPDAEVRTRLESALKAIEANDKTSPTLLTLHFTDAPPNLVAEEIARQAKIDFGGWPDWVWRDAKKVTIRADRQPFWPTVRDFCGQAGLVVQMHMGRPGITLGRGEGFGKKPAFVHEGFLVVADNVTRTHSVDYANPGAPSTNFHIQCSIFVDPKMRVLRTPGMLKLVEAVDENGKSLAPPANPNVHYGGTSGDQGYAFNVTTPLAWSPDLGRKIASFKATARVVMQTSAEVWEIPDALAAQNLTKQVGDTKYTLKSVAKQNEGNYNVSVSAEGPAPKPGPGFGGGGMGENPAFSYSAFRNGMRLLDAEGRAYDCGGGGGGGGGGNYQYQVHFYQSGAVKLGPPVKLVWSIPSSFKDIEIPVEFKDLPLP